MRGAERRFFFPEFLPALFERTLVFDEGTKGCSFEWIFTGKRGGFTIRAEPGAVSVQHRYYDSFAFNEMAQSALRHPEWCARQESVTFQGEWRSMTVTRDHSSLAGGIGRAKIFRKSRAVWDAIDYSATRSLFVPDRPEGFIPEASNYQLRVFGAYSRRVHEGMIRVGADVNGRDLLAVAFAGEGGLATLVALNRSTRSVEVEVEWPGVVFDAMEVSDPYNEDRLFPAPQPDGQAQTVVIVRPGALVTLTNVPLKSINP